MEEKEVTAKKSPAAKTVAVSTRAKKSSASVTAKKRQRLAMFIDVDNAGISRENLLEILFFANGRYDIKLCKLYGFSEDTLPGIRDIASQYNLITVGRMKFKPSNTNCLDSRLLIDAYDCAVNNGNGVDTIFVWCYPCDLAELFEKIVSLGITTATIDNDIFDCQNKYVSQTFKLYSQYNLDLGRTYGQIQNTPTQTSTTATDNNVSVNNGTASTNPVSTEPSNPPKEQPKPDLTTLDGNPIPVLPRREILERHRPATADQKTEDTDTMPTEQPDTTNQIEETENATKDDHVDNADNAAASDLVADIARRLNLDLGNSSGTAAENINTKPDNNAPNTEEEMSLMDIIKKAGFMDTSTTSEKKYEDTIGDL